jgi:hypothetical protein
MLNVYLTNDGSIVFNPRSENGRMLEAYKHRTGKSEYSLKKYQKEDRIEEKELSIASELHYVQTGLELALQKKKDEAELRKEWIKVNKERIEKTKAEFEVRVNAK